MLRRQDGTRDCNRHENKLKCVTPENEFFLFGPGRRNAIKQPLRRTLVLAEPMMNYQGTNDEL